MILGHLDWATSGESHLRGSVWQVVFEWLKKASAETVSEGEYEIRGRDIFVKAQGYQTVPRGEARFEVHRRYIDVQCALKGAEAIEWCPAQELKEDAPYDEEKDVWFVNTPARASLALIYPRYYAILWPGEAHMPKVALEGEERVFKVCVKVKADLMG